MLVEGNVIELTEQGYLVDASQWSPAVANALAEKDACVLAEEHWLILHYLRDFYKEYEHSPAMRILIKSLKEVLGEEKSSSQYLYTLFPYGPAKQATKYAGLPKPKHCI